MPPVDHGVRRPARGRSSNCQAQTNAGQTGRTGQSGHPRRPEQSLRKARLPLAGPRHEGVAVPGLGPERILCPHHAKAGVRTDRGGPLTAQKAQEGPRHGRPAQPLHLEPCLRPHPLCNPRRSRCPRTHLRGRPLGYDGRANPRQEDYAHAHGCSQARRAPHRHAQLLHATRHRERSWASKVERNPAHSVEQGTASQLLLRQGAPRGTSRACSTGGRTASRWVPKGDVRLQGQDDPRSGLQSPRLEDGHGGVPVRQRSSCQGGPLPGHHLGHAIRERKGARRGEALQGLPDHGTERNLQLGRTEDGGQSHRSGGSGRFASHTRGALEHVPRPLPALRLSTVCAPPEPCCFHHHPVQAAPPGEPVGTLDRPRSARRPFRGQGRATVPDGRSHRGHAHDGACRPQPGPSVPPAGHGPDLEQLPGMGQPACPPRTNRKRFPPGVQETHQGLPSDRWLQGPPCSRTCHLPGHL